MQTYIEDSCVRIKPSVRNETDLPHAIKQGQFVLRYQPQVDLRNGHIAAVEALLFWNHSVLGDIPHARFISIAETMGLTGALSAWVVRAICEQGKKWREAGAPSVPLAVNVSAKYMACPAFAFLVAQCLAESGYEPPNLELVLMASDVLGNEDQLVAPMRVLKELGVSLTLANVDSTDSHMRLVKTLPLDKVKLDGVIVRQIGYAASDFALGDAIIAMSHQSGLTVIAEQVDTEEQAAFLTSRSCDLVQGDYFSGKLSADACLELLRVGPMSTAGDLEPKHRHHALFRASRSMYCSEQPA